MFIIEETCKNGIVKTYKFDSIEKAQRYILSNGYAESTPPNHSKFFEDKTNGIKYEIKEIKS